MKGVGLVIAVLLLCCSVASSQGSPKIFDVLNYGAIGDGQTDDSQAFVEAWEDVCEYEATNTEDYPMLLVPESRTFLLQPTVFQGHCNSPTINFKIDGLITAPNEVNAWTWQPNSDKGTWLLFQYINGFIVNGIGSFDGQGSPWWECDKISQCDRPEAVSFHGCEGLQIDNVTVINTPMGHLTIDSCNNSVVSNVYLTAPADSHNTDGIGISGSWNVTIRDSIMELGDDCVSISGGANINIFGVHCGPGHGISIGSLGIHESYGAVEAVHVRNCTFNGSTNAARIKTWKIIKVYRRVENTQTYYEERPINHFDSGGYGYVRNVTFEDITVENVQTVVNIDQHYLSYYPPNGDKNAIQINDVTYRNFRGTSTSEEAVQLMCDDYVGCTNLNLEDIQITSSDPNMMITATCLNAYGTSSSSNIPQVLCLKH